MEELNKEEKLELANEICKKYFDKNFGTVSKADFETLIFDKFIKHYQNSKEKFDDYKLSKELGITQSRVRSLRERKELKYPTKNFNWKDEFNKILINAKYDESTHTIKVIVDDVNVMNEIRHYIENNGWYDEVSLNKKLLSLPIGCCVDLLEDEFDFKNINKKCFKTIEKDSSDEVKKFLKDLTKDGLKNFLMNASKETIKTVLNSFTFGVGGTALEEFFKGIVKIMG